MPSDDALRRAESCEAVADRLLTIRGEPSFLREVFTAVIDRQRAEAEQRGHTRGWTERQVHVDIARLEGKQDGKAEGTRAERERILRLPHHWDNWIRASDIAALDAVPEPTDTQVNAAIDRLDEHRGSQDAQRLKDALTDAAPEGTNG